APIIVKEFSNPLLNANIHSNNEVILNGETILIDAFVTYVDNIIIDGDNIKIKPNYNPQSKPAHFKKPSVNIPSIDIQSFKANADLVYDGDKELSGTIKLGTAN